MKIEIQTVTAPTPIEPEKALTNSCTPANEVTVSEQVTSPKSGWVSAEHWAALGQYEKALDGYNQALTLNPNDAEAWIRRGGVLTHLDGYEEALQSFEKALAIEPDNQSAMLFRGATLHHLGRYKEAYASYAQGLKKPQTRREPFRLANWPLVIGHWVLGIGH